ncbi:MAG TPA: nucleoside-diphosphate sugar epimerase/dehydratase [Xanthobacteraceae bacterium]|nr:nucleoside-diphosphate sugar epimerase/dehydratase [Xanthobacteraceae bacterium]
MRSLTDFLIDLPRFAKRVLMLMLDVLLCFVSIQVSFFLRLGEWQAINSGPLYATIVALPLAIPLFITQGLYRAIFRYSTTAALQAIARSTILFGLVYVAIFTFVGVAGVPRTIGIIGPILLFLFVAGSRVFADWLLGSTYRLRIGDAQHSRAVIYGVGDAGRQLAMALGRTPDLKVVGFVAEEVSLRGATLAGLPVYAPEDLQLLAETEKIDELLLAAPELSRTRRTEIVQQVADIGLHVRTIPSMTDIARGKISVADLKEVAIEDLLSRQPVPPDEELLGVTIRDRVVMVTGAGGSIGSELCRQIWDLQPARLLLVDSAEYNLYLIHEELTARKLKSNSTIEVVPYLGSVRDEGRMEEIMRHERPQTIYHAAAYKHVPLVEANPKEGLSNNVFGTWVLIGVASRMGTEYFILVSSDKAVRPTNVMGATKRMAELIVQAHARRQPDRKFSMVRFGNVLGSSGSVVPKFREQIAAGGPVTITHPEMTRYFMTIPEAAQLVLQAGAMTEGGEVFVLNMGEPVKILELARNMIRLSGLTVRDEQNVDGDIAIQTIGIRRGEKLFEELLIGDNPELSSHPRIMKARESELSWDQMRMAIEDLEEALNCNNIDAALGVLRRIVKEYRPKKQDFSDDKSDDLFLTVN